MTSETTQPKIFLTNFLSQISRLSGSQRTLISVSVKKSCNRGRRFFIEDRDLSCPLLAEFSRKWQEKRVFTDQRRH